MSSPLQSENSGDEAEEGSRAGSNTGSTVAGLAGSRRLGTGSAGNGLSLGAGSLALGVGLSNDSSRASLGSVGARVAVAVVGGAGALGSTLAGDVVVLGDAVLGAVGVLLGLLGRAVTLGACGNTRDGVVGLLLVGGGDLDILLESCYQCLLHDSSTYSDAVGLASGVTRVALVEARQGRRLSWVDRVGLSSDLRGGGRASGSGRLGADKSGEDASDEDGETHVDELLNITELVLVS